VEADALFILAMAGDRTALSEFETFLAQHPQNEYLHRLWAPMTHAVADLRAGRARAASDRLTPAIEYDLGDYAQLRPTYLQGMAQLALGSGADAAAAFQKIIDHPGVVAETPLFGLAQLGIARASMLSGETEKARAAFKVFFATWKDADRDLPVIVQAKREYARLGE
jgi:hypothetical protein